MSEEITYASGFSGIGGFDKGLEQAGGFKRAWSNDINKYANQIYISHFGELNHYSGDIRGVDPKEIPSHDIFCGGFPCQSFSVAGKRKGFTDTRGTLFFEICRIAAHHKPKLLFLENVKGLLSAPLVDETGNTIPRTHGRVFETILKSLEELGYWWEYQVLNSKNYGVPQNRQRVFIIGHLREGCTAPIFPVTKANRVFIEESEKRGGIASTLDANYFKGARRQRQFVIDPYNKNIKENGLAGTIKTNQGSPSSMGTAIVEPFIKNLPHGYNTGFVKPLPSLKANSGAQYNELVVLNATNPHNATEKRIYHESDIVRAIKPPHGNQESLIALRHVRTDRGKEARKEYQKSGQDNTPYGEGFREFVPSKEPITGTVTTGINKDALIGHNARIRRLTPVECERLQGFPDGWTEGVSDTQRYKCLGNAVTVNVIEFLGHKLRESINSKSLRT